MNYTASLDKTTKILTSGISLLFIGITAFEFLTFPPEARWGGYFATMIMALTYGFAYVYRPTGYTITDALLIVHRPIGKVTYRREQIESVRVIEKESLKFTIRTFGVGGLFGYYGKFYNSALGKMTWYLTRRDHLVLIRTDDNKTILLSPDELDAFTNELAAGLPALS